MKMEMVEQSVSLAYLDVVIEKEIVTQHRIEAGFIQTPRRRLEAHFPKTPKGEARGRREKNTKRKCSQTNTRVYLGISEEVTGGTEWRPAR